jgi:hypothetical protein
MKQQVIHLAGHSVENFRVVSKFQNVANQTVIDRH